MRGIFRKLRAKKFLYKRLVEITVSRKAILHNLRAFRKQYGLAVAPVLKSNAYGHGLTEVARILEGQDVPFLCVDSFFEALVLRNERITAPILIIGYTPLENIRQNTLKNVAFAILSFEELSRLASSGVRAVIHLKIDTGMHRHGIASEELDRALGVVAENMQIRLEGMYSHIADADTKNSPHATHQVKRWNVAVLAVKKAFPGIRYLHFLQTSGSFYADKAEGNVMRLGIGLYGISSGFGNPKLRPALSMRARITSLRTVEAGSRVGYNATFTAKRKMRIASIPVGYNEGVDRRLSNKGVLSVRDVPCPVVGRVSMNITSIDVSAVPEAKLDDEVLVISDNPKAPNSIANMAETCGTISYELLVHLPQILRRTVGE